MVIFYLLPVLCLNAQTANGTDPSSDPVIQEVDPDSTGDQQQNPPKVAKPPPPVKPEPSESEVDTTVFIPTEEISDDSPVPFPIDI